MVWAPRFCPTKVSGSHTEEVDSCWERGMWLAVAGAELLSVLYSGVPCIPCSGADRSRRPQQGSSSITPKKGSRKGGVSTEPEPLDQTVIHPESYPAANRLLQVDSGRRDTVTAIGGHTGTTTSYSDGQADTQSQWPVIQA